MIPIAFPCPDYTSATRPSESLLYLLELGQFVGLPAEIDGGPFRPSPKACRPRSPCRCMGFGSPHPRSDAPSPGSVREIESIRPSPKLAFAPPSQTKFGISIPPLFVCLMGVGYTNVRIVIQNQHRKLKLKANLSQEIPNSPVQIATFNQSRPSVHMSSISRANCRVLVNKTPECLGRMLGSQNWFFGFSCILSALHWLPWQN